MPNWCNNYATFTHKDPEQVAKFVEASQQEKLFESFVPFPNGEWDYGWCIDNWGTKWDASNLDIQHQDSTGVSISFDTAWGPPRDFYEKMKDLGFEVDATYFEEGMQFAGHYTSDGIDYSYEYDFNNENWRDEVEDEDVKDILDGLYESWKEWQEMNGDEDGENADEERH